MSELKSFALSHASLNYAYYGSPRVGPLAAQKHAGGAGLARRRVALWALRQDARGAGRKRGGGCAEGAGGGAVSAGRRRETPAGTPQPPPGLRGRAAGACGSGSRSSRPTCVAGGGRLAVAGVAAPPVTAPLPTAGPSGFCPAACSAGRLLPARRPRWQGAERGLPGAACVEGQPGALLCRPRPAPRNARLAREPFRGSSAEGPERVWPRCWRHGRSPSARPRARIVLLFGFSFFFR